MMGARVLVLALRRVAPNHSPLKLFLYFLCKKGTTTFLFLLRENAKSIFLADMKKCEKSHHAFISQNGDAVHAYLTWVVNAGMPAVQAKY